MDYEKKYKEGVEWLRDWIYLATTGEMREQMEKHFPELKESEDERIRKELIFYLRYQHSISENFEDIGKWIAWLEKQESEPNWCHHKVDLSNCSEEYRKAYYDGWNNCNMQHSQCKSESNDVIKCLINGMKFYYEDNEEATWGTEKFSMKVKDILSWLEKQGEQKPEWTTVDEQNLNVVLSHIPNECLRRWLKEAIHVRYNKPTEWGEEDEKMLNLIIAVFEVNHPNEYFKANELNDPNMRAVYTEEIVTWLESLKDRIQPQPKQEWSEKDEGFWDLLLAIFTNEHPNGVFTTNNIPIFDGNWVTSTKIIAWLKSIKDKYTWTPSDEQIGVIEAVINNRSFQKRHLDSLYEQLKKLKGE